MAPPPQEPRPRTSRRQTSTPTCTPASDQLRPPSLRLRGSARPVLQARPARRHRLQPTERQQQDRARTQDTAHSKIRKEDFPTGGSAARIIWAAPTTLITTRGKPLGSGLARASMRATTAVLLQHRPSRSASDTRTVCCPRIEPEQTLPPSPNDSLRHPVQAQVPLMLRA